MSLFSFDSPFMSFLGKACEYMIISLICALCCIPVITAGAAFTAQYYVGMKLIRGEDTPFFKAYFKSFKENFKQATIIWLIELVIGAFFAWDWYLIVHNGADNYNMTLRVLLLIVTLYFVMASIAIFALIARFQMTIKEAIRGALAYTYVNVPRMLLILVLTVFPTVASFKYFNWLMAIWPVGSAAALYIISYHFAKSFKKLENRVLGIEDEEEASEESEGSENDETHENDNKEETDN